MPPDPTVKTAAEDMSATLEDVLVSLGAGVGRSQAELDRHSIEIQKLIAEDPVLSQYGAEATWYQIPTTELELKIAFAISQPAGATPGTGAVGGPAAGGAAAAGVTAGALLRAPRQVIVQPVNAKYANQFGFSFQAASTIKLTIVPVPPPGGAIRPAATEGDVLAKADQYLIKGADGKPLPRVSVNYNPGAKAWYVVQTAEDKDPIEMRALVKVDDETLNVLKHV